MKRLWIRAHALLEVEVLAFNVTGKDDVRRIHDLERSRTTRDPNEMIVIDISDDLAAAVMADPYLILAGEVLAEGEEPPYVGRDPRDVFDDLTPEQEAFIADIAINGDGLTNPRSDGEVLKEGRWVDRAEAKG